MNASKARDFFSAYYEGELTNGLKEAFERALINDVSLKMEYDEFCSTMKILAEPCDEIVVPHDLHDKIMARLDHQAWETKQNQKPSLWGRSRLALFGGVAAVALVAGVLSINQAGSDKNSTAGLFPPMTSQKPVEEKVSARFENGSLMVQISASSGSKFVIQKISDSSVLADLVVRDKAISQEIINENGEAQAFSVLNEKGDEKLLIVLPGTNQGANLKGQGTVMELSMAMADAFRTPMIIRSQDREKSVQWDFKADADVPEQSAMLKDQGLNLSVMEDRILLLSSF